MGATMKDIARVTGLGLATISSYLNGEMSGRKTGSKLRRQLTNWISR